MKRGTAVLFVLALLLITGTLIAGCTILPGPNPPVTSSCQIEVPQGALEQPGDAGKVSADEAAVVAADNRFAYDMYLQLARDPRYADGNIFFSPFSISSAFAIAYEGARTTTADQIRSVFSYPAETQKLRMGYARSVAHLAGGDRNFTLCTANALWAEKTYPFLPAYTDTVRYWYAANATNLDFIGQPDASRQTINAWVAGRTNNKITDLLAPGTVDPSTRLGITNAVYFKGTWERQFDPKNTQDADFHSSPAKTVTVKMMEQTDEEAHYLYAETADLQMLSMPYKHGIGSGLSMVVLLPRNSSLQAAVAALDPENLTALEQNATTRRVMVYFPKFTTRTDYSLAGPLAAMGMPDAFGSAADFSGMDGTRNLNISSVIHSAYVSVDEEGTEAAAATAIMMGAGAAAPEMPVVFRADHPFIILIQDNDTKTILFIGRIVNPASP
jgi:serpin B